MFIFFMYLLKSKQCTAIKSPKGNREQYIVCCKLCQKRIKTTFYIEVIFDLTSLVILYTFHCHTLICYEYNGRPLHILIKRALSKQAIQLRFFAACRFQGGLMNDGL